MLHIRDDQMKQLATACNTTFIEDTVSELRLLFPKELGSLPRAEVHARATAACCLFEGAGFVYLQQLYQLIGYELVHGPEFWRQLPIPIGTQMFDTGLDAYERFVGVRDVIDEVFRGSKEDGDQE
jgi:hypothetical protein